MEIAQVGVRTRARAALAMEAASSAARARKPKRTKINSRKEARKFTTDSSAFVHLKSRTRTAAVAELETVTVLPEMEKLSSSPTSDEELPASCCSSNGSIGLDEERIKSLDLKVEESAQIETSTCNCGEELQRREKSHSDELREKSQELGPMETNSHRLISTVQNMPTELELEEFFATAEREIQKRFQDKYNYDIVKDLPLEGRYEWVQLKP